LSPDIGRGLVCFHEVLGEVEVCETKNRISLGWFNYLCVPVSEAYQYGGTPDTIALIGNGVGLIEFKTSAKPYPDHLVAMAAHGRLWQETHPQHPLTAGYHLLFLPKDGSPFQHHSYTDLSAHWKLFTLYLEAYALDKALTAKSTKAKPASAKLVSKNVQMTMGEMLRAYGHLKECSAC
jgi:hypothetical protein